TQSKLAVRAHLPLGHQHARRDQQADNVYRIQPRKTRSPEMADLQLAALRAVAVVVSQNKARHQQEEADRGVAVIDDGSKRAEPFRVREVVRRYSARQRRAVRRARAVEAFLPAWLLASLLREAASLRAVPTPQPRLRFASLISGCHQ